MTVVEKLHADHGATFGTRGGRQVPLNYGRPETAVRAVRNGVGVIEMGYGVVVVEGDDRIEYVDNVVSNRVPEANGEGRYALLLDPQGRIQTDMYVYNAGERLLLFTPPDRVEPLVEEWSEKIFIEDVALRDASADFGVFGVHGPRATEKVASVLNGAGAPESPLSFVRGSMGSAGVTVVATDGVTGEEGYEVVCAAADASDVFDTLLNHGENAAPFGYDTWDVLTVEAGSPMFDAELKGEIPNVFGLRNALDFDKGCYVGQEVVSRVENRGQPSRRLVGVRPGVLPTAGAAIFDGADAVGEVTRAVESPILGGPIALGLVDFDCQSSNVSVRIDRDDAPDTGDDEPREVDAEVVALPFVEGSARSARLPEYGKADQDN